MVHLDLDLDPVFIGWLYFWIWIQTRISWVWSIIKAHWHIIPSHPSQTVEIKVPYHDDEYEYKDDLSYCLGFTGTQEDTTSDILDVATQGRDYWLRNQELHLVGPSGDGPYMATSSIGSHLEFRTIRVPVQFGQAWVLGLVDSNLY